MTARPATTHQTQPDAARVAAARRATARRRAAERRRPRLSRLLAWLLSAVLGGAGLAYAQPAPGTLPSGGRVVVGQGQVQQGSNLLIIQQSTQRLGMDWQSFNIGSAATVEFRQPSSASVALNRVVGNSGSEIYGKLKANGQVFLTNPHGVLFAPGSKVDVGGLVASTLDLTQQDFDAGRYQFKDVGGQGSVVNQGTLRASASGYLALFGKQVDNQGEIAVDAGQVLLATGNAATISISGNGLISAVVTPGAAGSVLNSGSIQVDGGVVRLTAASAEGIAASLVNNSGLVRANTITERGGEIWITGDTVVSSGQIQAAAPNGGDGGRVMLIGDMQRGTAQLAGNIDASAASGKGGFVETSAASVTIADSARVTTTAPGGSAGTWLIDPTNFAIVAGGGASTSSSIGADTLSTNLGGGNVTIATAAAANGSDLGDISVGAAVTWSANKLTLNAHNNISVNAALTGTGTASLAFEYGQGAVAAGNTSTYTIGAPVNLPAGNNFSTKLGSNGTPNTFTVVVDAAGLQGIDSLSRTGNYAVGANIDLASIGNFNPIGNEVTPDVSAVNSFGGRFEGLGNTVSGLTTNGFTAAGLFATTSGADIRNLALSGGSVSGIGSAGALAAVTSGTSITRVTSTVPVSSSSTSLYVGGLVGQSTTGSINGSSVGAPGSPVAISGGNRTGGLVGYSVSTPISSSSAGATLTGTAVHMGGLVGWTAAAVSSSSSTGSAQTSGNAWLGGLVGETSSTVTGSSSSVDVTATHNSTWAGGLIGATSAAITGSTATGSVTGGALVGGLVGNFPSGGATASINSSSASGNVTSNVASASVGGLVGSATGAGSITGSSATGNVTAASNGGSVGGLVGNFSMSGGIINSTAGAAASGQTPATTVNGGSVTGGVVGTYGASAALAISDSNTVAFLGSTVTGSGVVGGLVGAMGSTAVLTISGTPASTPLTTTVVATGSSGMAGGVAGRTSGIVSGFTAAGTVTSAGSAGGLIGHADGAGGISNVRATGAVTGTGTSGNIGGLVGTYTNSGNLTGTVGVATAIGPVQGGSGSSAITGGLVGSFNSVGSIVNGSTAVTSTVRGGGDTGGLVGQASGTGTSAITGSTARGEVTGGNNVGDVGGLVGDFSMAGGWSNVTVEGAVSGGNRTGGLAGHYNSVAAITGGIYTPAAVSGGDWVGGVIGYMSSAADITGPAANNPWVLATHVTASTAGGGVGVLAGRTNRAVNNIRTTGTVSGGADAGGVIGVAAGTGGLGNLTSSSSVTSSSTTASVGGVVGHYANSGNFANATGSGSVSGGRYTGGVVGEFRSNATLQNLRGEGNVSGAGDAGGIIGFALGTGSLATGVALGAVSSSATSTFSVGGAIGYFNLTVGMSGVSAAGNVTGGVQTGGVVGDYGSTAALTAASLSSVLPASGLKSVSGTTWVGGLIGYMESTASITGLSTSARVTATGTNTGGAVGGLVGRTAGAVTSSSAGGEVTGNADAGGAVGLADGSGGFTDVTSTATVRGGSDVGGLVGRYTNSGALLRGTASGAVVTRSVGGGLVGTHNGGAVTNSVASGTVTGTADGTVYLGGLIGTFGGNCCFSNSVSYLISGSNASGTVRGDSSNVYAGGLIGLVYSGHISASSSTSAVTAQDSLNAGSTHYTGGLVGYFGNFLTTGTIKNNSSASGAVTGTHMTGGLVGYYRGTTLSDVSASGPVVGDNYVGGLVGYADSYESISNASASGTVTARSSGTSVGGLFGQLNLQSGGLSTGFASGRVQGIAGSGQVGGLIGRLDTSSTTAGALNDSAAIGNVSGGFYTGGLVGYYDNFYGLSPLLNSRATGNVTGGQYAGGLLGTYYRYQATGSADDVTNSFATGSVSGSHYVGGLIGEVEAARGVAGSYATGNVIGTGTTSTQYLGGLVGRYDAYHTSAQALAPLRQSYATGSVLLASNATLGNFTTVYAGGLVGRLDGQLIAAGITDAYATGAVTLNNVRGQLTAGGLVGFDNNQSIQRSYATGAVSATGGNSRVTGGLVGGRNNNASSVTDSYWNITTTGQASSFGGGTGVASAALLQAATFANWDIAPTGSAGKVWRIYEGFGNPLLTRFLTPLALTLADASKIYDGNKSFGNASLSSGSGAVTSPDRIFTSAASADVGSYQVAAAGVYSVQNGYDLSVSGSATLSITPKAITLAGVVADKVYDGNRAATLLPGAQPSGLVAGEDLLVNLSAASAVFDTRDVGQNKAVSITGLSVADGARGKAANYSLASSTSTTASIARAALNVGGFTATSRAYDGSTTVAVTAPGGAVSGAVFGDDVTVDIASVSSGTIASKGVGTAKPVTVLGATLSGNDAGNYRIDGIDTLTADITPRALTVNGLVASNREYDRSINVSVSTSSATLAGVVAGDEVVLRNTNVNGTLASKDVAYTPEGAVTTKLVSVAGSSLTLRGLDAVNYTAQTGSTTVTISPREVSYFLSTSAETNRLYDGTNIARGITPFLSNVFGADNLTITTAQPTFGDKNVAYNSAGAVTSKIITATGGVIAGVEAPNYRLTNTTRTTNGTISPLPLTVEGVVASNRAYDGTVNIAVNVSGATVNTSTVIPTDTVTVTLPGAGTVTGTVANKNIGNAKAVTVPGFSLSGADAPNYTLTGSTGVTVNITRKPLTATYTAIDKVYDGQAFAALSVTSSDIAPGDDVRFFADQSYCTSCGYGYFVTDTSTPGNFVQSKDVGTGKRVVVTTNSLFSNFTNDANNYTLLNPTATISGSITPKGITPVFTGVNKVYDGNTTATVNVNLNASGIFSGDAVSLDRTATFSSKDAGTGKAVSITGIAFTGIAASNYTLTTNSASTTAAITPKPLSVLGVTATDRPYNGELTVALTAGTLGASGVVDTDVITVDPSPSGLSGTIANKNAGTAKAVTVSGLTLGGAAAGNYLLDGSLGVTVNITPRPLTAVYTGVDRVYTGGVAAVVTPSSADLVPGDTPTLTFSQNAVFTGLDARNVGSNKPVSVTGIVLGGTSAANYTLQNTSASTTASITAKGITVSYTGLARVYNGLADTSANVEGRSSGLVAGDAVSFSQTAIFTSGAAGDAKPVAISNIALGGAQGSNYSLLSTTASTTASITRRLLGVTGITAADRVYDGTRVVSLSTLGATVLAAGVLTGDQVTVVLPPGGITSGTVATKDVGNNKDVTITGLTLTGNSAANYAVGGASGLSVDITPRPLTALYAAANKVYDGTATAQVSATSSGILGVDLGALGFSVSGAFTGGKNVGDGKTVAVSGGFLTGVERNNYTLLNPVDSTTANITPKTLTAAYTGNGTRVYNGGITAPVTATNAGVISGDTVVFSQTAVFAGAADVAKNVGNGKAVQVSAIGLSGSDAGNYRLASTTASTTASVTPKFISIDGLSGATATNRTYNGGRAVDVVVTTTGTVTPSSADIEPGDNVTINLPAGGVTSGTMLTKAAGQNKPLVVDGLTLSGTDEANYRVAATTGVTVDIAPKPLTAVYVGVNKVYDGGVAATVTGSSTDVLDTDSVSIAGSGIFVGSGARNVGNGKSINITSGRLGGADAGNYALTNPTGTATANITQRPLTPSYSGQSKVYDGSDTALVTATAGNAINGDALVLSQSAVFTAGKNVGADKTIQISGITLAGSDAGNYLLTTTSAVSFGAITPKPLRIEGLTGVAAVDRTYNGSTEVDVVVSASGPIAPNPADLIGSDVVTVNAPATGTTTGTMLDKSAGTAKPVNVLGLELDGADAANYSITATSGVTVNITPKALTAVYNTLSRVYDGTAAASVTGSSGDLIVGDAVLIGGSAVFSGAGARNVGTNKLVDITGGTLSGADATNYQLINPTGSTTGSITPRTVTVSYLGGSRVYDGSTAAPVTGSASGFIVGDSIGLAQTAVFSGAGAKNAGVGKAVEVSAITLTGTDAGNYALAGNTASTTATVTPKPLRIEGFIGVVATDRVYNGSAAVAISVQSTGIIGANSADVVGTDDVTVVPPPAGSTAGLMADKHAGQGKPVTVAGIELQGADALNYSVAAATGVTVNIAQRPLNAVYAGLSRVYDGTDIASITGSSIDILAGDLVSISGSGLFTGAGARNVGNGKAISVTGGALGNADARNYLLVNPSGSTSADISPRMLTPSYTGGTRVYDGSTTAPVLADLSDLVAGDDVRFGQTAVFIGTVADARNVGDDKAVQVSGITLLGNDAANYGLMSTATTTIASITPRPLNVSGLSGLQAVDREYDGTSQVDVTGTLVISGASADVIPGDDVQIGLPSGPVTSGTMVDKSAGQAKPVALDGLSLSGSDAPNYALTGTAGLTVNIARKPVTLLGLTAIDRDYDATTLVAIDSSAGNISGALFGDDLQLQNSGVTGSMADKHAGAGKAVTVAGLSLAGADAANYSGGTDAALQVNIARRSLVASMGVADKVYDGDTGASVTLVDDRIAGDDLTLAAASARFDTKNVGTGKAVSATGLTLDGADAANYQLASTGLAGSASITPAPLTVSARSLAKVYGESAALQPNGFDAAGLVAGETIAEVTLASTGGAATASVVDGPYAISVADARGGTFDPVNYSLSYVPGLLTVTPRPVTVATNSVVRFDDEPNPLTWGFSTSQGDLLGGDSIASVLQNPPAGSADAPGVSVFRLVPSGVSFGSGDPRNYDVRFGSGLLVVLPKPPRLDDIDADNSTGDNNSLALSIDPAQVSRAEDELDRVRQLVRQPQDVPVALGPQDTAEQPQRNPLTPSEIQAMLAGDSRNITLPLLQRLPLLSFDPALRRLIEGGSARSQP